MGFDGGAAAGAGPVGGVVMSMLLYAGIAMMPRQMSVNLFRMLGTMVFRDNAKAYVAGAVMHETMSKAFGVAHVAVYVALGLQGQLAAWGVLFGFVHWLVSGVGLAMVPAIHPMMRRGRMSAPGPFTLNYPSETAMGFLMPHILHGGRVAALYGAFA